MHKSAAAGFQAERFAGLLQHVQGTCGLDVKWHHTQAGAQPASSSSSSLSTAKLSYAADVLLPSGSCRDCTLRGRARESGWEEWRAQVGEHRGKLYGLLLSSVAGEHAVHCSDCRLQTARRKQAQPNLPSGLPSWACLLNGGQHLRLALRQHPLDGQHLVVVLKRTGQQVPASQ